MTKEQGASVAAQSDGNSDPKLKRAKRSPFKGVLERAVEDHADLVELGRKEPTDDIETVVRTEAGKFLVSVRRIGEGTASASA